MADGKRWTVQDRDGNEVYLTDERWTHIVDGHPEMRAHEDSRRQTVRLGRREQDLLAPQKFRTRRASLVFPRGTRTSLPSCFSPSAKMTKEGRYRTTTLSRRTRRSLDRHHD